MLIYLLEQRRLLGTRVNKHLDTLGVYLTYKIKKCYCGNYSPFVIGGTCRTCGGTSHYPNYRKYKLFV
uniref:Uncharacterized protein n=1 Tax=Megaviridae environmental sample TaxID=1737588 RepID=A0A5J6VHF9_9VIRU|nr:MAG: hypothetical protein [Megaviridae environmental sample]